MLYLLLLLITSTSLVCMNEQPLENKMLRCIDRLDVQGVRTLLEDKNIPALLSPPRTRKGKHKPQKSVHKLINAIDEKIEQTSTDRNQLFNKHRKKWLAAGSLSLISGMSLFIGSLFFDEDNDDEAKVMSGFGGIFCAGGLKLFHRMYTNQDAKDEYEKALAIKNSILVIQNSTINLKDPSNNFFQLPDDFGDSEVNTLSAPKASKKRKKRKHTSSSE